MNFVLKPSTTSTGMQPTKKNKELVTKIDHIICKSDKQKKILKKILSQLNKQKDDLEDQVEENKKKNKH